MPEHDGSYFQWVPAWRLQKFQKKYACLEHGNIELSSEEEPPMDLWAVERVGENHPPGMVHNDVRVWCTTTSRRGQRAPRCLKSIPVLTGRTIRLKTSKIRLKTRKLLKSPLARVRGCDAFGRNLTRCCSGNSYAPRAHGASGLGALLLASKGCKAGARWSRSWAMPGVWAHPSQ